MSHFTPAHGLLIYPIAQQTERGYTALSFVIYFRKKREDFFLYIYLLSQHFDNN